MISAFERIQIVVLATLAVAAVASAQAPEPQGSARAGDLGRSIQKVIRQSKYTWRMPPPKTPVAEGQGKSSKFWDEVGKVIQAIRDWIRDHFQSKAPPQKSRKNIDPGLSAASLQTLVWVLLIVAGAALVFLLVRVYLSRRKKGESSKVSVKAAQVKEAQQIEDATPDQMPEDSWLGMARDLIAQGELRLALRAMYLACLAHLGQRELIRIERSKSNRQYLSELRRRAAGQWSSARAPAAGGAGGQAAALVGHFEHNMTLFEWAWYGMHEVTMSTVSAFQANQTRIKACLENEAGLETPRETVSPASAPGQADGGPGPSKGDAGPPEAHDR